MPFESNIKNTFTRPQSAKAYVNYGKVLLDTRRDLRRETINLPALAKLRPMNYRWYQESTSESGPQPEVLCGGNVFLNNALNGIGVLLKDSKPSVAASCVIEGVHALPLEYDAAATYTSNLVDLNGKNAYYVKDTGKITDAVPGAGDGLLIGRFTGFLYLDREVGTSGFWFAGVDIMPELFPGNTAIALPADAGTGFTFEAYLAVTLGSPNQVGLTQSFNAQFANADPNYPIAEANLSWTIDGTTYAGTSIATHTFAAAGAAKTLSLTVTIGGSSLTVNYTVDVALASAPANLTKV